MDNIYGDAPRCILAESIRDNGLDATLESYSEETKQVKELLNSDKTVDLVFGLDILSFMLCDGGHTDFYTDITTDLQEATAYTELRRIVAEEPDDIRAVLLKKWYGYYSGIMETKMKIEEYDSGYDQYQAIFDEQTEEGNRYRYFEYNNTGIFVYTNYNDDVVRYFKKALDIAKAHGMKNFILDDSINGGGSTESCMYMLNAITPDKRDEFYYEGTMTGNATYEKLDYDMDQDGKFEGDSEDFDYDFNYAVLCSQDSYSSGNLLPCLCKEAGIPLVLAKAMDDLHAKVLSKVGVDRVIFPERDMGARVARSLVSPKMLDLMTLNGDSGVAEIVLPESWSGRTLEDINVRRNYRVTILAVRRGGEMITALSADYRLQSGDTLLVLGEQEDIDGLEEL